MEGDTNIYSKITILYSSSGFSSDKNAGSIYSSTLPTVDKVTYEDVCIKYCGDFLIVEVLDSEESDYITCHPFNLSKIQSYRLYD